MGEKKKVRQIDYLIIIKLCFDFIKSHAYNDNWMLIYNRLNANERRCS